MNETVEQMVGRIWVKSQDVCKDHDDFGLEFATRLRDELTKGQEPVAWQFFQDGRWWNGNDKIKDHRKNTEEAGYPIRNLYPGPFVAAPSETESLAAEVAMLREALKHYANTYCEGWCRENGGEFSDCGGCAAKKVLSFPTNHAAILAQRDARTLREAKNELDARGEPMTALIVLEDMAAKLEAGYES